MTYPKFLEKAKSRNIFLIILGILVLPIAYKEGMSEDIRGDYFMFWTAGLEFWQGKPIYSHVIDAEGFTYPPFAAMYFQILAILPFNWSAVVFDYINFGLWTLCFFKIADILKILFPNTDVRLAIVVSYLASARFFWHNHIWMQVNVQILLLCLLGVSAYLKGKENWAIFFFLFGTFYKIMPVIFLFPLVIKGNEKTIIKILVFSLFFIISPILWRGFSLGIQDYVDYYEVFIKPFSKGKIYTDLISLSLPAAILKLTTVQNYDGYHFNIVSWSELTAKRIGNIFQVGMLAGILLKFVYNRFINKQLGISANEISLVFLTMLLITGRTWEGHHVVTGFVYASIIIALTQTKRLILRNISACLMIFLGIIGKDTVGNFLYIYSQGFSLITFTMLLFWGILFFKNSVAPSTSHTSPQGS